MNIIKQEPLKAEFTFHNVGQGLFYSGRIETTANSNKFNFVYDCGSNNKDHISAAIISYHREPKIINCLILSHLDEDHTNGLNELLPENDNGDIIVILPYHYPSERVKIGLNSLNTAESWWFDFISDPVYYLLNIKKVGKIVIVGNGETDSTKELSEYSFENLEDIPDDENLIKDINKNEDWLKYPNQKSVLIKKYGFTIKINQIWKFKFYNHSYIKNIGNFHRHVQPLLGENPLTDLKSEDFRKSLRNNGYKNIHSTINQTSLMLYHAPIKYQGYIRLSCSNQEQLRQKGSKNGQLLSGDISFAVKWKQIASFFKDELKNIAFVQIPHHGAITSWRSNGKPNFKAINDLRTLHWINSSSSTSKKYPSRELAKELFKYQYNLHCCNENNLINLKFESPAFLREIILERTNNRNISTQACDLCYCSIKHKNIFNIKTQKL